MHAYWETCRKCQPPARHNGVRRLPASADRHAGRAPPSMRSAQRPVSRARAAEPRSHKSPARRPACAHKVRRGIAMRSGSIRVDAPREAPEMHPTPHPLRARPGERGARPETTAIAAPAHEELRNPSRANHFAPTASPQALRTNHNRFAPTSVTTSHTRTPLELRRTACTDVAEMPTCRANAQARDRPWARLTKPARRPTRTMDKKKQRHDHPLPRFSAHVPGRCMPHPPTRRS